MGNKTIIRGKINTFFNGNNETLMSDLPIEFKVFGKMQAFQKILLRSKTLCTLTRHLKKSQSAEHSGTK